MKRNWQPEDVETFISNLQEQMTNGLATLDRGMLKNDPIKILTKNRGFAIPEKYGKVHSSQWKPEWLLTETDETVKYGLRKGLDIKTN